MFYWIYTRNEFHVSWDPVPLPVAFFRIVLVFGRYARTWMDQLGGGDLHNEPTGREEQQLLKIAGQFRLDDFTCRESRWLRVHSHRWQIMAKDSKQSRGWSRGQSVRSSCENLKLQSRANNNLALVDDSLIVYIGPSITVCFSWWAITLDGYGVNARVSTRIVILDTIGAKWRRVERVWTLATKLTPVRTRSPSRKPRRWPSTSWPTKRTLGRSMGDLNFHVSGEMITNEIHRMYLTLHSYSQMWLVPWGYTYSKPSDYSELVSAAKKAIGAISKVHGTNYKLGPSADLLYPTSGTTTTRVNISWTRKYRIVIVFSSITFSNYWSTNDTNVN